MKRWIEIPVKVLAVALVTVAATSPVNRILQGAQQVPEETGVVELGLLVLLTEIVFAAALVYPVLRSAWSGFRLFGAVFFAVFGLNVVLTQVEAAIFLTMGTGEILAGVTGGTVHAAVVAAVLVLVFRRRRSDEGGAASPLRASWSAGRFTRRLALCAACYVGLYFGAGMLIWPFIREFYATQEISAFAQSPWILPFQLLRGALYVLFLLPLLHSLEVDRRRAVLALAVLVPVLAGAPGLLLPNPYMPEHVRLLHMIELGWSNCVYGALVAFLFWRPRRDAARGRTAEETAAAA